MHPTTATTDTRAPRQTTTTRREPVTTTPTRATPRTAAGDVLTWHGRAGIGEWARHARSANGFGD